jgi:protein TonB
MDNHEDKSYKNEALIGSLLFHAALFAIFFFFVLRTPDPPLSEGGSGIELNYGTVDEGSGDIQTMNEANASKVAEETAPSPETPPEAAPEPVPENIPEPVEDKQPMMSSEDPEDAHIEEKKEEKKQPVKEVVKKPEVAPVKPQKVVEVETPKKEEPVVRKEEPVRAPSNGKTGTEQKTGGNSNGDREGKVGDQGNPNGDLNAKALYGNLGEGGAGAGGAGGNKLDLTGWKLAFKLEKKDVTNENGKIVYQIKVDDKGDLVSIVAVEKTVSPAVEKFYRQQIEDNWAVDRSKDNTNPPPIATGKYTVFVRSK